ncbi:MAG: hypothetical protein ACREMD_10630 [Gemmatimonadota bacterium]
MTDEKLSARLERDPVRVECPICRHRQRVGSTTSRCDHCGSEITVHGSRSVAEEALEDLVSNGRLAYLTEPVPDLWAVIANRSFGNRGS